MKLLAATRSKGKQPELRRIMEAAGHEVIFPDEAGIWEDPAEEMLEHESSFEGNARKKAEYFARLSGLPTFADDSGLEVAALGGEPGVRSARFAGPMATDQENNRQLLARLAEVPAGRRQARFVCTVALVTALLERITVGEVAGTIEREPRGTRGFGYDPLFFYAPFGCTFGEADPADGPPRPPVGADAAGPTGQGLRGVLRVQQVEHRTADPVGAGVARRHLEGRAGPEDVPLRVAEHDALTEPLDDGSEEPRVLGSLGHPSPPARCQSV